MDIERLTKTQIVLLTLLVSFMTSIATGIVTVTLLDQAPPAVTQTINRVVERTVERVVPDKSQGAGVVTTEKTIVVKESDLITESINTNSKYLVRIFRKANPDIVNSKDEFVAIGTVVTKDGFIATDGIAILDSFEHLLVLAGGETFDASLVKRDTDNRIALLRIKPKALTDDGSAEEIEVDSISFGDPSALQLGTTVIALSGKERTNVAIGIVSGFETETVTTPTPEEDGEPTKEEILTRIKTNIATSDISLGSPLIDLFGEVVGIYTSLSKEDSRASYVPISVVLSELAALKPTTAPEEE